MKKFISILAIFTMLFSLGLTAIASDETELTQADKYAADKIGLLSNLEIFEYEYDVWDSVSRAEYALILAKLLTLDKTLSEEVTSAYSDVEDDDSYAPAINCLKELGIMNGKTATEFYPEDELTLDEAAAGLIRLLGYEQVAQAKGGYAGGYKRTAIDLGAMNGVTADMYEEYISAGAVAIMICNLLDTPIVNNFVLENTDISVGANTTVTIAKDYLNLLSDKGKVNSYDIIDLYGKREQALELECVEINGTKFEYMYDAIPEFLGYDVTYYYKENKGNVPTLVYASKNSSAKEITVYSNEISAASSSHIEYKDSKNKRKTYKLQNPIVLYNGYAVPKMEESYVPKNGYIKMISNNGSSYDVLMIFDYESFVVKSNLEGIVGFQYGAMLNGENSVDLSGEKIMASVRKDGEIVGYDAISKGQAISIAYNPNVGYFAELSGNTVDGVVDSSKEDPDYTLTINGNEYKVNPSFLNLINNGAVGTSPVQVGQKHSFIIDFLGKIVGMTEVESVVHYGYIKGIKRTDKLTGDLLARIYSSESGGWKDYSFDEKCQLNGKKATNDEIIAAVEGYIAAMAAKTVPNADGSYEDESYYTPIVKFKVSNEGLIKNIVTDYIEGDHPEEINENKIVISSGYRWGYYIGTSGYIFRHNTYAPGLGSIYARYGNCMLVPMNEKEEEFKLGNGDNIFPHSDTARSRRIVYDLNEFGIPGCLIRVVEEAGLSVKGNAVMYAVDSVSRGVDGRILNLYQDNGSFTKLSTVDDADLMSFCDTLKQGDIIQVTTNTEGNVIAAKIVVPYNSDEYDPSLYIAGGDVYSRCVNDSTSSGIAFLRFDKSKVTTEGTVVKFNTNLLTVKYLILKKIVPVVIYDGTKFITGTVDDLVEGDVVTCRVWAGEIWSIVCYRNSNYTTEEFHCEKN